MEKKKHFSTESQKKEGHGQIDSTMETSKREHSHSHSHSLDERTYPTQPYASMPIDTFPQQVPWPNPNEVHTRQQEDPRNPVKKSLVVMGSAELHAGGHVSNSVFAEVSNMPDRDEVPSRRHVGDADGHACGRATDDVVAGGPHLPNPDEVPSRRHDAGLATSTGHGRGPPAVGMGLNHPVPGAVIVPGIDTSPRSQEEPYDDRRDVSRAISATNVTARVVDEAEERRILREQIHQVIEERDREHEAIPIASGNGNVPESNCGWHGTGRKRLAIGAVLVTVATAIAVVLVLMFGPDPPSPPVTPTLPPTSALIPPSTPPSTPASVFPEPMAPTPPPYVPQDLMDLISSVSFDDGTALNTVSTPQNSAFYWLADNLNLDAYSDQKKIQRYALATLYFSTNGGEAWDLDRNWLTNEDECGGWGSSVECDSSKVAESLVLADGLNGTIPDEIALLSGLAKLDLADNHLIGSIPSTIGEMTKLTKLSLSRNSLNSTMPTTISQLTNLVDASFSENLLSGLIPSFIGQFTALQELNLFINYLTGHIPTEISRMTSLAKIRYYENMLTGPIPYIFDLTDLTEVRFDGNKMTGTIPSFFQVMSNLEILRLYNNSFTGSFECPPVSVIESCLVSCKNMTDNACRIL